jgi:hypothetical protein
MLCTFSSCPSSKSVEACDCERRQNSGNPHGKIAVPPVADCATHVTSLPILTLSKGDEASERASGNRFHTRNESGNVIMIAANRTNFRQALVDLRHYLAPPYQPTRTHLQFFDPTAHLLCTFLHFFFSACVAVFARLVCTFSKRLHCLEACLTQLLMCT